MVFCSLAVSALLRLEALRAGFFAAGFLGLTDLTAMTFLVFLLAKPDLTADFCFAFFCHVRMPQRVRS